MKVRTGSGRQVEKRWHRSALGVVLLLFAVGIFGGGCESEDEDEPQSAEASSVAITTEIDFSTEPFTGSFEVTEGSEDLGCTSGTFVDTPVDPDEGQVEKTFTCAEGEKEGTFTVLLTPEEGEVTPWQIVKATEDFAGLTGEGDFSVDENVEEKSGVETLTGEISY